MNDEGFVKLRRVSAYFDETPATTRKRAKRLGIVIAEGRLRVADFEAMKRAAERPFRTAQVEARP